MNLLRYIAKELSGLTWDIVGGAAGALFFVGFIFLVLWLSSP